MSLPSISGQEVTRLLVGQGWSVMRRSDRHLQLRRGPRIVVLPLQSHLSQEVLAYVLDATGLRLEDLLTAR